MSSLFERAPALIGMLHVRALPGTPRCSQPLPRVIETAVAEARQLRDAGFDALLLENMHDAPYLNAHVGPEIVAAMTAVGCAVRREVDCPLGVQVLAAANREALACALACGADFIRVENFAFAHVADEGLMPEASAGPLLRFRRQIDAGNIRVLADVKKKHAAHALTSDIPLADAVEAACFCGADGVIITGTSTAAPTVPADLAAARQQTDRLVLVGSGVTPERLPDLWPHADGFIVGSYLKADGHWANALDADRLGRMIAAADGLR